MKTKVKHSNQHMAPANSSDLTVYDLLKAERDYQRHLRTASPRTYSMRVHEDGSVYLHSHDDPANSDLLSFEDVRSNIYRTEVNNHRPLWHRMLLFWL